MLRTLPAFFAPAVAVARWQAVAIAIGVVILTSAIAAEILFLVRRGSRDLSLPLFGLVASWYSVRLLLEQAPLAELFGVSAKLASHVRWAITSTIPVLLLLFLMQVLEGHGRRFFRFGLWVACGFAAAGIAVDVSGSGRRAYLVANNLMIIGWWIALGVLLVLLYRNPSLRRDVRLVAAALIILGVFVLQANLLGLGIGHAPNLEPIGFLLFVGFLGYIAATRTYAKEEQLVAIHKELEIARQIQNSILPRQVPRLAGLEIATRYLPMGAVAGDFYDFLVVDDKHVGIAVADVTGHGVPAALIASMLKVALAAEARHALEPSEVLAALNGVLCGKFEAHFVTAAYLYVDLEKRLLRYAAAGHPPLLFLDHASQSVEEIESNGLCLGVLTEATYPSVEKPFAAGDRCLLYTDGLLEARNGSQEEFGKQRLEHLLVDRARLSPNDFAEALIDQISRWISPGLPEDDITALVVGFL